MVSSDSELAEVTAGILVEKVGINEGQALMPHHACLARRQWTMVATNIVDKQEKHAWWHQKSVVIVDWLLQQHGRMTML